MGHGGGMCAGCRCLGYSRIAAEAGFGSCGMWVDPESFWDDKALALTRLALADTGLSLVDVEPAWLDKPAAIQRAVVEAGIELGARNVLVVSREPDEGKAKDDFRALCELADGRIRIVLEFGVFTEVKSLAAARAFIADIDHPTAGILIDQMHLNRSGEHLPELGDPMFPYIQACDFYAASTTKEGMDYIVAAVDERCPLGEGDASVDDTNRIRNSGVDVSLEIRSKDLRERYPDPVERARQIFERCPQNI